MQSTSTFRHPWKNHNKDIETGGDNPLNDVELEIMEHNKIKLDAKNKILAIEDGTLSSPHQLDT